MRRRFANRERRRVEDDGVLPMINVVFLLLTFFMIAGVIRPPEAFDATPPAAEASDAPEAGALTIALSADGRAALGGREMATQAVLSAAVDARPSRIDLRADADVPARAALALAAELEAASGAPVDLVVRLP